MTADSLDERAGREMRRGGALFVGHGSPMNAVEENRFTKEWKRIGEKISAPSAIVVISAHWYTNGTRVMANEKPGMVYDMYGFPRELYKIKYEASGDIEIAERIREILKGEKVILDYEMGYDHGVWSILHVMYPHAEIPVIEVSVDRNSSPRECFELGKRLASLRDEGILLMASGNVVHNFNWIDFTMTGGHHWAAAFDSYIKEKIKKRDFESVIGYRMAGEGALKSFSTLEHFLPLLYILGAVSDDDTLEVFNDEVVYGALSMTGYLFLCGDDDKKRF